MLLNPDGYKGSGAFGSPGAVDGLARIVGQGLCHDELPRPGRFGDHLQETELIRRLLLHLLGFRIRDLGFQAFRVQDLDSSFWAASRDLKPKLP